jgi:hypothetical protein
MSTTLFILCSGVSLVIGCAALGIRGPRTLLDEAKTAIDQHDQKAAYLLLKQIATEFPDSSESLEAFPMAADCLKALYFKNRLSDPASVWVTSEPDFMFEWLARYFSDGFPEEAANTLLAGFPGSVFRRFEEFAKTRPQLSQWAIQAHDDNGIVQSVTASRSGTETS